MPYTPVDPRTSVTICLESAIWNYQLYGDLAARSASWGPGATRPGSGVRGRNVVAEEETAVGLWFKLESLYMTKSLTNKLFLKRRLFSLRMEEGTTLRDHLDQLNTILLELRNIDVKVDDEDAALILLVSLPLSYENFVDSFIGGRDIVTLEEVRSSLHTREMRHKATGTSSDSQVAGLVASGSMGQGSSGKKKFKKPVSKGSKSNDVCNYCKE